MKKFYFVPTRRGEEARNDEQRFASECVKVQSPFLQTTGKIEMGINRSTQQLVRWLFSRRWCNAPVNRDGYEWRAMDGGWVLLWGEGAAGFYFGREMNGSSRFSHNF